MSPQIIDLSIAIEPGLPSDPEIMIPKIDYVNHEQGADQMEEFFPGLKKSQLPNELGWSLEFVHLTTHSGTHMDAPFHYHPTMDQGTPALTIDQVPLDWCFRDGVVLDFSHKPELASCNLGSMNFALFPILEKIKEWKYDWEPQYIEMSKDFIFRNTFADLERIMGVFNETGTKPEFEAYDIGHLHNAHHYYSRGKIEEPFYVQFVTGILGGIASTIPHLLHMKQTAEMLFGKDFIFSTIGAGKHELPLATASLLLGGGARVGLEDNLWLFEGEMAKSNAELVEKMVRIARELGFEPYTPDETREVLGLKGRDRVKM